MRKWRCVGYNQNYEKNFTIGKIYYGEDDKGIKCDDGFCYDYYSSIDKVMNFLKGYYEFEEVFEKEEDKKMDKFKVGDRVRIIGNKSGHRFNIGDIVELYEYDRKNEDFRARTNKNEYDCNWVRMEELELVENIKSSVSRTFTITTSDSTTTLTDGTHTTTINRYYTDKHDDMIALEEVVKKYKSEMEEIERKSKEPKVGDMVKVVDNDRTYSTYYKWFFENKITDECAMNWQYNRYPNNSSRAFRVVATGKHSRDNVMIALIADDVYTYLINIEGLEVIK